jgi:hypothetical protein
MKQDPSSLKIVGVAIHLVVAAVAVAMAALAGMAVIRTNQGLTDAGVLVALVLLIHVAGAVVFAVYRPDRLRSVLLLGVEGVALVASLYWLSLDFIVAACATLVLAIIMVALSRQRVAKGLTG